jgi:hypothetical protein
MHRYVGMRTTLLALPYKTVGFTRLLIRKLQTIDRYPGRSDQPFQRLKDPDRSSQRCSASRLQPFDATTIPV